MSDSLRFIRRDGKKILQFKSEGKWHDVPYLHTETTEEIIEANHQKGLEHTNQVQAKVIQDLRKEKNHLLLRIQKLRLALDHYREQTYVLYCQGKPTYLNQTAKDALLNDDDLKDPENIIP